MIMDDELEAIDNMIYEELHIPEWMKQADRVLESYAREAGFVRADVRAMRQELLAVQKDLASIRAQLLAFNEDLTGISNHNMEYEQEEAI